MDIVLGDAEKPYARLAATLRADSVPCEAGDHTYGNGSMYADFDFIRIEIPHAPVWAACQMHKLKEGEHVVKVGMYNRLL